MNIIAILTHFTFYIMKAVQKNVFYYFYDQSISNNTNRNLIPVIKKF